MLKSPTGVLVGHIFANAAEEKIVFLKMAVGEETLDLVLSFGREDSARGIGARISREGLGKMSWRSSVCVRVRYPKTIPRRRGIAYS